MTQPAPAAAEPVDAATWSAAQLERLEAEWRGLRRAFAYHPSIEVVAQGADPPAEYQVTYRVTTLVIDETGQLVYVSSLPVQLWLPPHFPHTAPVVRPLAAAFHPNATAEWIHLNPPWRPEGNLVDLVTQVGFLLAFRSYDPHAVANPVAMNWVVSNPHLLPTDAAADFTPGAGGEPLTRLMRFGLATVREIQERVEAACERLVTASPAPARQELEQLLVEARLTLPLFLEPEVPEHLRTAASEVMDLAESLVGPDDVWSQVARQIELAGTVGAAADEVGKAEEALRRVMALEASPPPKVSTGAGAPPPAAVVQTAALALRRAGRDAEQSVATLRTTLADLAAAPRLAPATPHGTLRARRVARELARLAASAEPARASGGALASLEPVLQRARDEAAAADRAAAWAELADLLRRGQQLVDRAKAAGPASLQAYTADAAGTPAGPFEFEQPVPLGASTVAVANVRGGAVRVVDVETEEFIARGDGRVALPASHPAAPATLVVGEHTDELRIQLDYLLTHARDALTRLRESPADAPPLDGHSTWVARLASDLDRREPAGPEPDYRKAADTWKQLSAELAGLGRFKQRAATYHLLNRVIDFARRSGLERERLTSVINRAEVHLAEIGARSGVDAETDRLIIPAQFATEYAQHMSERDGARQRLRRIDSALGAATERLRLRNSKPKLFGSAEPPALRLLPAAPPAYAELQPHLADDAMAALIASAEQLLGASVRTPPAAPTPEPPDAH